VEGAAVDEQRLKERLERNRKQQRAKRAEWEQKQRRAALEKMSPAARRRALAKEREAAAKARANGERKPSKPRKAKPLTEEQKEKNRRYYHEVFKPKTVKLPAFNQPLPGCPRERALFLQLQFDAVVWRRREAPDMPTDPAKYFRNDGSEPAEGEA
jgi:hypothetical protein